MPVQLESIMNDKVLIIKLSGKLSKEDYHEFLPKIEAAIERQGKIRMLVEMHDFHGWEMGALWEDLKFDVKHFRDIERLALVGESKWEKGMAWFCKPFTSATVRYFDASEDSQARLWLETDQPQHA